MMCNLFLKFLINFNLRVSFKKKFLFVPTKINFFTRVSDRYYYVTILYIINIPNHADSKKI